MEIVEFVAVPLCDHGTVLLRDVDSLERVCKLNKRLSELSAGLKEAQAVFTANQQVREQELAALRKRRAVDAKFFLAVQSAGHKLVNTCFASSKVV